MNMDDGGSLIYGIGALLLMVSSLAARRLPIGSLAKMTLAWLAIFAALFIAISYRFEFKQIWNHVKSDISGTGNQQQFGKEVRLKRGDDGHFSAILRVNGKPISFMVDTGATMTSMSSKSSDFAEVNVDRTAYPVIVDTANGAVKDWRATANLISLEAITINNHNILVSDGLSDEQNLLGMNFLGSGLID
jgi:aspartyl protease family protein